MIMVMGDVVLIGLTIVVADIRDGLEDEFWHHVEQDPLDYYWFMKDWKLQKEDTDILIALQKDRIKGMMVVFKNNIVQLRGNREATVALLDNLSLDEVEMMAPSEYEDLVLERFEPRIKNEMVLMHLQKGDENIKKHSEVVKLVGRDAEQTSDLMRRSYPDWWGKTTPGKVKESMKRNLWLGVKLNEEVVAVGSAFLVEFGSLIGIVATNENHRNKGHATSVVSALVESIFQEYDEALIHVLKDNHPAVRAYKKVGFKPYKSYLLVKDAKKKD